MHHWTSPTTVKKKEEESHHTWRQVPAWDRQRVAMTAVCLSSNAEKKKEVYTADKRNWNPVPRLVVQPATNDRVKSERRRSLVLRPVVQPTTNDRVKNEKRPTVPLYVCRRITRLKIVNSEPDRRFPFPTQKGIRRRAHVILPNPTWVTHLLRLVRYIELWCGMHRTCKTHSIKSWSEKKLELGADPKALLL